MIDKETKAVSKPTYKTIRSFPLHPGTTTYSGDNDNADDFHRRLNEAVELGFVPVEFSSTPIAGGIVHSVLLKLPEEAR